jgi:hypothetical protein
VGTLGPLTNSKILTGILGVLLILETVYILWGQHPINRFKPVDEDGYLAFDSATGQLCKTARPGPGRKKAKPSPSAVQRDQRGRSDPILEAFDKAAPEAQAEQETRVEFIRGLPSCADIR